MTTASFKKFLKVAQKERPSIVLCAWDEEALELRLRSGDVLRLPCSPREASVLLHSIYWAPGALCLQAREAMEKSGKIEFRKTAKGKDSGLDIQRK